MSTGSAPTSKRDARADGVALVIGMAALMWVVELIDSIDSHRLDQWGIVPRTADGLVGVVAAPFLHAGWGHLIGNTIPFVAMGCAIALGGAARVVAVTVIVGVLGGLGTWLIAPAHTDHIGASGIVFGYATYLISRGVFNKSVIELLGGVVVVAVWGTALLGGLVPTDGISWQGHFCGGVAGVIAASLLSKRRAESTSRPAALAP
jgi:membrane associated rhomboid family serine protease